MSVSGAHAAAFYREVMRSRRVWTIMDESGFPAPISVRGRAIPFWSSPNRAELVIEKVAAYKGFTAVELELEAFLEQWIPGLSRDQMMMTLNWPGDGVVEYDLDPKEVGARLLSLGANLSSGVP